MILGNTAIAESATIAHAIRKAVAGLELEFGGSGQITVSVGAACVIAGEQQTEDFLFQEADRALYAAKAAGRNRVALG